jgi:general stress protein 26
MPRRVRPRFPDEWHIPNDPKLWISWAQADDKLRREQVYWISTASKGGKPHAAPVWGIWKREAFFFETAPNSVKGRNLGENPRIVVHVQDGLDTVIVEGTAVRVTDRDKLGLLAQDYVRKYDYNPDWSNEAGQIVLKVLPNVAHAWRAPRMHRNLVNFIFNRKEGPRRLSGQ